MRRDAAAVQGHLDDLVRRCRDAGMNVTPQRLAIYRALLESHDHPSPETLHDRLRGAMPSLSLATVYKALDALERLGVVSEVSVLSATKRFDANRDRHHHLVCTRCRKVVDYYNESLDAIRPARRINGFVTQAVSVQILGLCEACASSARPRRR
jgi:Fur family peroxide stress response transcriptional regulator